MKNEMVYLFTAKWCQPCNQLKTRLLAKDLLDKINVIDVDELPDFTKANNVRSVPTILYKDGNNDDLQVVIGDKYQWCIENLK